MRFGEASVDTQCTLRGRGRLRKGELRRNVRGNWKGPVAGSQPRIRERIPRVSSNGFLEERDGPSGGLACRGDQQETASQEPFVRLRVIGVSLCQQLPFLPCELEGQLRRHPGRDGILNREDVGHPLVEVVRPQLFAVADSHQPGRDPDAVVHLLNCAVQDGFH